MSTGFGVNRLAVQQESLLEIADELAYLPRTTTNSLYMFYKVAPNGPFALHPLEKGERSPREPFELPIGARNTDRNESGPESAMDEGYLVLHELDARDVRMVGEFLTDFKDLLPPRVPPPRATNRLAGDQPGYARQINIRKQKKSDLFEPPKNERVTTHCSAAPNKKTRQDNRIAGASGHVDKWHRAVLMPARERPFSYILFILSILSNQETGTPVHVLRHWPDRHRRNRGR